MNTNDWNEVKNDNYSMYSVNNVPYPLDEYLKLIGKPTTKEIAEVLLRWPNYKSSI